jgi:hypothetical protein
MFVPGLGSRVVAARLVRELMRLSLLLGRRFMVYSKWLGIAFSALPEAAGIASAARAALDGPDAGKRQAGLCEAYELAGAWQNRLGLAAPVDATRRPYFDRPYPVIGAGRFAAALLAGVTDPDVARLPPVGAVDQYVDSTPALTEPRLARALMTAVWR